MSVASSHNKITILSYLLVSIGKSPNADFKCQTDRKLFQTIGELKTKSFTNPLKHYIIMKPSKLLKWILILPIDSVHFENCCCDSILCSRCYPYKQWYGTVEYHCCLHHSNFFHLIHTNNERWSVLRQSEAMGLCCFFITSCSVSLLCGSKTPFRFDLGYNTPENIGCRATCTWM